MLHITCPFQCCCCSFAQSCQTLCKPMNCSTPGLPIPHHLKICPSSCPLHWWCHPAIASSDTLFCPQSFPASGPFPMSRLFASDDQNTGVSTSASVLPTSFQGWFPLRLTGWSPCSPRDSQESSPASQIKGINSLMYNSSVPIEKRIQKGLLVCSTPVEHVRCFYMF